MNNPFKILFLLIFILVNHLAWSQENFREISLVTNVFEALKEQNEDKLLKCLPSKEDIAYIIPVLREAQPNSVIPEIDKIIANFKMAATKNFKHIITRGNSFNITWENMVLEKVEYEANHDPNVQIERGNITLVCTSGDKKFLIVLKKSYKIHDTWLLMDRMKFTLL
ncbi:hypothetical protein [Maribacter ulvicola]|uniref:Uncharacterized protein n=1 Tax=Maribacter ulvicola TaxID=228959 RepID=A0A1N6RVI8_9FLAO|nr:hypothetical protein [Maribacter ulvicola]SIQ32863.1 hypothetical protein SAMN05421797_1011415 [Maribacter ulvicola]